MQVKEKVEREQEKEKIREEMKAEVERIKKEMEKESDRRKLARNISDDSKGAPATKKGKMEQQEMEADGLSGQQ